MMTATMTIVAAGEPTRGWGGPIAIAIAVAAFIAFATALDAWQRRQEDPSPTEEDDPGFSDPAQVSAVSDTDDTTGDTGWWGRIVETPDGRRFRVPPAVKVDAEVDLDLDDGKADDLEETLGRMLDQGISYAKIVRSVMRDFGVSESTAKRRIREVREQRARMA